MDCLVGAQREQVKRDSNGNYDDFDTIFMWSVLSVILPLNRACFHKITLQKCVSFHAYLIRVVSCNNSLVLL